MNAQLRRRLAAGGDDMGFADAFAVYQPLYKPRDAGVRGIRHVGQDDGKVEPGFLSHSDCPWLGAHPVSRRAGS